MEFLEQSYPTLPPVAVPITPFPVPAACLSVVVLVVFLVNVSVTDLAEDLVETFSGSIAVDLKNKTSKMRLGYYLIIPYTVLSIAALALIYMYDHAAYKHRQEQQRPTEDAPKEIMMY